MPLGYRARNLAQVASLQRLRDQHFLAEASGGNSLVKLPNILNAHYVQPFFRLQEDRLQSCGFMVGLKFLRRFRTRIMQDEAVPTRQQIEQLECARGGDHVTEEVVHVVSQRIQRQVILLAVFEQPHLVIVATLHKQLTGGL